MLNYKGYEIPGSYEEIKESLEKHSSNPGFNIPTVCYYIRESLSINSTITLEEFKEAEGNKEKEIELANRFRDVVTSYIDIL